MSMESKIQSFPGGHQEATWYRSNRWGTIWSHFYQVFISFLRIFLSQSYLSLSLSSLSSLSPLSPLFISPHMNTCPENINSTVNRRTDHRWTQFSSWHSTGKLKLSNIFKPKTQILTNLTQMKMNLHLQPPQIPRTLTLIHRTLTLINKTLTINEP